MNIVSIHPIIKRRGRKIFQIIRSIRKPNDIDLAVDKIAKEFYPNGSTVLPGGHLTIVTVMNLINNEWGRFGELFELWDSMRVYIVDHNTDNSFKMIMRKMYPTYFRRAKAKVRFKRYFDRYGRSSFSR